MSDSFVGLLLIIGYTIERWTSKRLEKTLSLRIHVVVLWVVTTFL
jgi:hypothetical protein